MLAVLKAIVSSAKTPSGVENAAYKVENDLAIRMCLEVGRLLEVFPQGSVVVDLSIDSEQGLAVIRSQWLSTSVYTDDS